VHENRVQRRILVDVARHHGSADRLRRPFYLERLVEPQTVGVQAPEAQSQAKHDRGSQRGAPRSHFPEGPATWASVAFASARRTHSRSASYVNCAIASSGASHATSNCPASLVDLDTVVSLTSRSR